MYKLVSRIKTSTGDNIILVNSNRESIMSARNKALCFILRNGGIGVYKIYNEDKAVIESKSITRLEDGVILRRNDVGMYI